MRVTAIVRRGKTTLYNSVIAPVGVIFFIAPEGTAETTRIRVFLHSFRAISTSLQKCNIVLRVFSGVIAYPKSYFQAENGYT